MLDGDFEKQLQAYELKQIADQKGEKLWSGEMPVASKLNEEVTTAFPVDTLLPNLKPGLYVIAASAADESGKPAEDSDSDCGGLQARRPRNGSSSPISASRHFRARTAFTSMYARWLRPRLFRTRKSASSRAIMRCSAPSRPMTEGSAVFEAGLTHGTGGLAPAIVVARGADADYGFLDITKQAFDLSDRGVGGRTPPGPLDAMVFTERGVYRPGENVYVTALLRDAAANAVPADAAHHEALPPGWRGRPAPGARRCRAMAAGAGRLPCPIRP